jgi:predicted ester cyclase
MTTVANKLLVRRYIEEVVNTGNIETISEFISPNYAEVYDGKEYELGIEGAKAHVIGVRETYPDLILTVIRQIAEGQWVVTSYQAHGTHQGIWLDIKPTGKKITITGINIDRVVNGKIVEHSGAANLLDPLLRIGAITIKGQEEKSGT